MQSDNNSVNIEELLREYREMFLYIFALGAHTEEKAHYETMRSIQSVVMMKIREATQKKKYNTIV